jgi:hypothetical protein
MIFMSFALTDGNLLAFYCLEKLANNFLFVNARDMIIVRLDAPRHDESNKPYIMKIQSLVVEIT